MAWAPLRTVRAVDPSALYPTIAPAAAASVTVDLANPSPISPMLYGIFFEEINHSGEGGLYAELVQDRSFEAASRAQKQAGMVGNSRLLHTWLPLSNTAWSISTANPLNPTNPSFARLVVSGGGVTGGITNQGFWGISVQPNQRFFASLYVRVLKGSVSSITLQLASADGLVIYGTTTLPLTTIAGGWGQVKGHITASAGADDTAALLAITFQGAATVDIDVVSLFPAENQPPAQNPFRADVLSTLQQLQPKFLRFPGGVYTEGTTLANAWRWKTSLDGAEVRPGHLNAKWQYWSTDGLGLYEYLLLAETLGAAPVWVVNVGISRQDGVTGDALQPYIQDMLDGIEFATGSATSTWGSVRARMGHPEPWALDYIGVGNENCGMNYYVQNYAVFYAALKAAYPSITVIANCANVGSQADMYDYHNYQFNADNFYDMRSMLAQAPFPASGPIFVSEYATRDGNGDLRGALAESAFMMGMEATAGQVVMAAYAPIIANMNDKDWAPTAVYVTNRGVVTTPSYWVQQLFANNTAGSYFATTTTTADPLAPVMAFASATCADLSCTQLAVKVVNYDSLPKQVTISLANLPGALQPLATLLTLTGAGGGDENDFSHPALVLPQMSQVAVQAMTTLPMAPWSLCILLLDVAGLQGESRR